MLTFIASLKFYSKLWPRAHTFSKLANIIGRAALPGTFKNTSIDEYDVFTQQYFIWLFRLLMSNKDYVKDFNDGTSFITKQNVQALTRSGLFFLPSTDLTKFETRLNKDIKQISKPGNKPFEGIDADVLLGVMLDEFIDSRNKIMKMLKNKYFKIYEVDKGIFRFIER